MVHIPKCGGALVPRLIVGLALLGCPQISNAAGTWSVISLPEQPGEVYGPVAMAVDATGDLYAAESEDGAGRVEKRDLQGNWSVVATFGARPGQVYFPSALAVDAAGNLYVAQDGGSYVDLDNPIVIQKRNPQGNWSVLAMPGSAIGQINDPVALAVDSQGDLYVADQFVGLRKRDAQGSWSVIATAGSAVGQVDSPTGLALDPADNLYVAERSDEFGRGGRIQKRDAQGRWSTIASGGKGLGQVSGPQALAVDAAGDLYVADIVDYPTGTGRVQKREAQGNWTIVAVPALGPAPFSLAMDAAGDLYVADKGQIQQRDGRGNWAASAAAGSDLGRVHFPSALAVDSAGNLYVADMRINSNWGMDGRIQERDAQGHWSVIATSGTDPGQIYGPQALAADTAGNLYVAESRYCDPCGQTYSRIQKQDAHGHWSVVADTGSAPGQVLAPTALAVDTAGNLYVAEGHDAAGSFDSNNRIQKRDAQGNWSVLAAEGDAPGQVRSPSGLAVDAAGNLYVADAGGGRVQMRDVRGNWSVLTATGDAPGQIDDARALAADAVGNLYVADRAGSCDHPGRIQQRDARGNWSVVATFGNAPGQVANPLALAVDPAGRLDVADTYNNRVQEYIAPPGP